MNNFHHSKGECEYCGITGHLLQMVNYWREQTSLFYPCYLWVCDTCFDTRKNWCKHVFPDNCEICNQSIEDADHCSEKGIDYPGVAFDKKGKVICIDCYKRVKQK